MGTQLSSSPPFNTVLLFSSAFELRAACVLAWHTCSMRTCVAFLPIPTHAYLPWRTMSPCDHVSLRRLPPPFVLASHTYAYQLDRQTYQTLRTLRAIPTGASCIHDMRPASRHACMTCVLHRGMPTGASWIAACLIAHGHAAYSSSPVMPHRSCHTYSRIHASWRIPLFLYSSSLTHVGAQGTGC